MESQNKIQPWVSANRPSNNWAQVFSQLMNSFLFVCASDYFQRYPVSWETDGYLGSWEYWSGWCFRLLFLSNFSSALSTSSHSAVCLSLSKCYSYSLQPLLALFPCKFIPFIIRSGHWINSPNNSNIPLDRQAMRTKIIINYRIFRTWLGILRTNPPKKFIDGVSFQRNCGAAR